MKCKWGKVSTFLINIVTNLVVLYLMLPYLLGKDREDNNDNK